jgi:arylsulfatase A-like enzyme
MSDNGAPGNRRRPHNRPLFAGKGTLYEGGLRVPLIIIGPGIAAGSASSIPVCGYDLFPTFTEWAGAETGRVEGISLTPLLHGTPDRFQRSKPLLFHYPHYGQGGLQQPQSAIISGNFKLLKQWTTGSYALFNLAEDLSEENDLSEALPEKAAEMIALMKQRLDDVGAQLPLPNPDYNNDEETTRSRNRKGEGGRRKGGR